MRKYFAIPFPKELKKSQKLFFKSSIQSLPHWSCFPLLNWKWVCFLTFFSDSSSAAWFLARTVSIFVHLQYVFKSAGLGSRVLSCSFEMLLASYIFLSDEGRATEIEKEKEKERWRWGASRDTLVPPQSDFLQQKKFRFHQPLMNALWPKHIHINYVSSFPLRINI